MSNGVAQHVLDRSAQILDIGSNLYRLSGRDFDLTMFGLRFQLCIIRNVCNQIKQAELLDQEFLCTAIQSG